MNDGNSPRHLPATFFSFVTIPRRRISLTIAILTLPRTTPVFKAATKGEMPTIL